MLVLSRQRDETILIGDTIEVMVVDIRGDKVRLGVNAPKEISVHRKEVYDAIRREGRMVTSPTPQDLKIKPQAIDVEAVCKRAMCHVYRLCGNIDAMLSDGLEVAPSTLNVSNSLMELCDQMLASPCDLASARSLLVGIKVSRRNLLAIEGSRLETPVKELLEQMAALELAIDGKVEVAA